MLFALTVLVCAGASSLATPACAAEAPSVKLSVRAAPHGSYGRIVFEAPSPMGFSAAVEDGVLVVRFDEPATATLAPIARSLVDYVSGVPLAVNGTVARIPLKRPVTVRTFTEGSSMVVDLLAAKAASVEPRKSSEPTPLQPTAAANGGSALSAAANTPPIPLRVGEHDTYSRLVFDTEKPVAYTVDDEKGSVTLHIATNAKLGPMPRELPRRVGAIESSRDDKGLTVHLHVASDGHVRHFLSGTKIVLDVYGADAPRRSESPTHAAAAEAGSMKPAVPGGKVRAQPRKTADSKPALSAPVPLLTRAQPAAAPAAASASERSRVEVTVAHGSDGTTIQFAWPHGVDPAAAIFVRAGYLWAVFDRDAAFDFVDWARADGRPKSAHPAPGFSVVRLKLPDPDLGASAQRDGSAWTVILRGDPARPRTPAMAVRNGPNGHPALFIPSANAGARVALKDPDLGDTLLVLPFRQAGTGMGAERRYADFRLLATAEGIAVKPLADGIDATSDSSGFEISSAAGLNLTPAVARVVEAPPRAGRVFDFAAWRALGGKGGPDAIARLQAAVLSAAAPERNARRLDLAHYYFAIGAFAETIGVLDAIASDQRELMDQPEVKALRGAARLQMNDIAGAASDLMSASLDGLRDVAPWRGKLAATQHEWSTALRELSLGDPALAQYPSALRVQFALSAAEAALEAGDPSTARVYIETAATLNPSNAVRDRLHWLKGRVLAGFGEYDKADTEWRKAIAGGDPWVRAHARFDRATTLLAAGKIARPEAISELEKLAFAWRGDALEYKTLTTLGDLDLAEGKTRNGLEALRTAVSHFPDMSGVDKVSAHMRDAFIAFHTDGRAAKAPALTDLALFEEFGDLIPEGPKGDAIVSELVGRLVQLDLLDRAEELLTDLVDHRLKGPAESKARNQLGLVYLMDRKPTKALKTLDQPVPADAQPDVVAARRELKARALVDTQKYPEALKTLAGDDSTEAKTLRADLFWRTNDWHQAAAALGLLASALDPKHLSDPDARLVMRDVIALALAGDGKGLADAADRFGAAMKATPFKDAFNLLTDANLPSPTSVQAITEQVAAADRFGAFLESYRTKLLKTAEAAQSANEPEAKPRTSAAADVAPASAVN
jgi:tetratricopeptide (TPR) repeat protein